MTNLISMFIVLASSLSLGADINTKSKAIKRKAASMQTPMQQSLSSYKAVLDFVAKDSNSEMSALTAIKLSQDTGKVELTDNKGLCSAYPFKIELDNMGLNPKVKLLADALASCN